MLRATMPLTTIYEQCYPSLYEYDIRTDVLDPVL